MKSMTGYHSTKTESDLGSLQTEMRSVNQKGLDIQWRMPRQLQPFEADLDKMVRKGGVHRGRITITMHLERNIADRTRLTIDEQSTKKAIEQLQSLAETTPGLEHQIRSGDLLNLAGLWQTETQDLPEADLKEFAIVSLEQALDGFLQTRSQEGSGLATVIQNHLARIQALVAQIDSDQKEVPQIQLARYEERIKKLVSSESITEDRLLQEAAHMADRLDVSEEINRLNIHVSHMHELLKEAPVGRKLDFMCQEFIREANTIGSKCNQAGVAHLVVELKAEVEKMREQVQNVE